MQAELALGEQIVRKDMLAEISQAIHQTLDVKQVLQIAVESMRQFLKTDRVIIFRFHPDWSGKVVAESAAAGCISILESEITDPCFTERYIEPYRQGRVTAIADFPASDIESCYKELMAQFQVRANLIVPILHRENLWALLIAHHCSGSRSWQPEEIEVFQQVASQLGIALQQVELYQKNAEQAALLDVATDAIMVRDLNQHILFWNKGAEQIYAWQASEVIGQDIRLEEAQVLRSLLDEEASSKAETANATVLEKGEWQGELHKVTKTGKEVTVASRWTLVKDEAGNPKFILIVDTDITDKKLLEAQFLRAQRLESLGTLASGIAHDMNNILTPILGASQLLPLKLNNPDQMTQQLLRMLQDNAKRGADLVKQILAFARGTEVERTQIQIVYILEELVKVARQTFPKAIEISLNSGNELWMVSGDATQLHQVLMNLFINARDAMPEGGTLTVTAENLRIDESYARMNPDAKIGLYVVITVADTGMGMTQETIERIFDPFFTTKEPGKGTGLGLSTVIGIIKSHQGFVNVYSEVGKGTSFKIDLL